jgi:hypothetical protein
LSFVSEVSIAGQFLIGELTVDLGAVEPIDFHAA